MEKQKNPKSKAAKKVAAAPAVVESAADTASHVSAPGQEEIARVAYSYWKARGGQDGSPEEDWLRAERELKSQRATSGSPLARAATPDKA